MPASESLLRALRARINWDLGLLRDALKATKGDVNKALLRVIDDGLIEPELLNAALVPEAVFVRAKKAGIRRALWEARVMGKQFVGTGFEKASTRRIKELERDLDNPKNYRNLRDKAARGQAFDDGAAEFAAAAKKPKRPATLKLPPMPPLPPLKWEIDEWVGKDTLKSWSGFRAGAGGKASSGKVSVTVDREEDDDGNAPPPPPADAQVAAYRHLRQNEKSIRDAMLKAVVAEFVKLKRRGFFDDLEDDEIAALGKLKSAADLKRHIEPHSVHILEYARGGHAYVGIDFACTWDDEHGLGVLLHKSRVVKVGDAEVSFNEHGAKRDGGKKIR